MDSTNPFYKQVSLLVQLLPFVGQQPCFALKGGTAINLFVRNLPRLSVDIDLAYIPMADRGQALADIDRALKVIAGEVERRLTGPNTARVDEVVVDRPGGWYFQRPYQESSY